MNEHGAGQYLVARVDLPVTGQVIDAAPDQAVTAMSPIQFQKHVRLQAARLLLANHPNDIAGVANRVGYDRPAPFSWE